MKKNLPLRSDGKDWWRNLRTRNKKCPRRRSSRRTRTPRCVTGSVTPWLAWLACLAWLARWLAWLAGSHFVKTLFESISGLASFTDISPVSSETDTTGINIGHFDQTHYVSHAPFNEETMVNNVTHKSQPARLTLDQCITKFSNETVEYVSTKEQKGKAFMKECMTRRRRNNEFRNKQKRALQAKRLENIEKTR